MSDFPITNQISRNEMNYLAFTKVASQNKKIKNHFRIY